MCDLTDSTYTNKLAGSRASEKHRFIAKLRLLDASTAAKSLQSCPTLCDPVDGSPPGSPVPGILQARALEWGAVAFSEHNTTDFKTWNTTRKKKK